MFIVINCIFLTFADYLATKCGVLIMSMFVFFTTTMSVSFTLRETQTRMLKFTGLFLNIYFVQWCSWWEVEGPVTYFLVFTSCELSTLIINDLCQQILIILQLNNLSASDYFRMILPKVVFHIRLCAHTIYISISGFMIF